MNDLTSLSSTLGSAMNLIVLLTTIALGVWLFIRTLLSSILWDDYKKTSQGRTVIVDDPNLDPPEGIHTTISELERLGLQYLGKSQVEYPKQKSSIERFWIFINTDNTVFGEVMVLQFLQGPRARCFFKTMFPDGALVEVHYPQGTHIDTPDFVHHRNTENLESAYQQQIQQVNEFRSAHGSPRLVQSMQDYIEISAIYRERYRQQVLRTDWLRKHMWPSVVNLVIVALLISLLQAQREFGWSSILVFGIAVVIVTPYVMSKRWLLGNL